METCRVCAESKRKEEFFFIPYFTKYKKHTVIWCRECQKMYMQMRKDKDRLERFLNDDKKFTVSFE